MQKRKELIEHCRKKREQTGFDLVIYANHIVPRLDISDLKSQFTKPDFVSTYDPDYVEPVTPQKISVQEIPSSLDWLIPAIQKCKFFNQPISAYMQKILDENQLNHLI